MGRNNSAVLSRETCSYLLRALESRSSEVKGLPKKELTSLWIFKDGQTFVRSSLGVIMGHAYVGVPRLKSQSRISH